MELLNGKTLVRKSGENFEEISVNDALKNIQIVGFYFSAHWCTPCRSFTPHLVDCYQELRAKKKPFEIIFVSADESADSAKNYMKESHGEWMSTAFDDVELHDALAKTFSVMRIPQLIIVRKNGQVVTTQGCRDIKEKGVDAFVAWFDGKPLLSCEQVVAAIAEQKSEKKLVSALSVETRSSSRVKTQVTDSKSEAASVAESDASKALRKNIEGNSQNDEIESLLEKAGMKQSLTDHLKLRSTPTRMLTIRDVEKHAVKSLAESSTGGPSTDDKGEGGVPPPRTTKLGPKVQKDAPKEGPATSHKTVGGKGNARAAAGVKESTKTGTKQNPKAKINTTPEDSPAAKDNTHVARERPVRRFVNRNRQETDRPSPAN